MRFQLVLITLVSNLALAYTTIPCSTSSGTVYRSTVPRTTISLTSTLRPTSTVYRTSLVTPPAVTRTVVSTISSSVPTTLTDKTTTFTRITLTFTRSVTLDVTSGLVTRTVNPTSYASAVVKPTGSAFRPISDTTASPGDISPPEPEVEKRLHGFARENKDRRALYPQRVFCTKRATVTAALRTVTSPFPTVTLPASTSIKPSTTYVTRYTTVYGGGVSTSVVSLYDYSPATTVATETVASTTTITASTVTAVPTTYAACGAENIIKAVNDDDIQDWYNRDGRQRDFISLPFASVRSAEQCCGICQESPTCAASAWNGFCYLLQLEDDQTCAGATTPFSAGYYLTRPSSSDTSKFLMSNGPCGALYNGGLAVY